MDKNKKIELINKNIDFFRLVYHLGGGVALQKQVRDFLVSRGFVQNNNKYYEIVNKLEKNGLISIKKYYNTSNYVIFVSRFIVAHFKKKQVKQVNGITYNVSKNDKKILKSIFKLENLTLNYTIDKSNFKSFIETSTYRFKPNEGDKYIQCLTKTFNYKNSYSEEMHKCMRTKRLKASQYTNTENEVDYNSFKALSINPKKDIDCNHLINRNIYFNKDIEGKYCFTFFNISNYSYKTLVLYFNDLISLLIDSLCSNQYDFLNNNKFVFRFLYVDSIQHSNFIKKFNIDDFSDYFSSSNYSKNVQIHSENLDINKKYFNNRRVVT